MSNFLISFGWSDHQKKVKSFRISQGCQVKFPCSQHRKQYDYQTTIKESKAQYKRAEHEGVKYTYRQCDNQATTEGCLTPHKMTLHLRVKCFCK